jgi:hypothetical protein
MSYNYERYIRYKLLHPEGDDYSVLEMVVY